MQVLKKQYYPTEEVEVGKGDAAPLGGGGERFPLPLPLSVQDNISGVDSGVGQCQRLFPWQQTGLII